MKNDKTFVIILSIIVVILGVLLVYYFSSVMGGGTFGFGANGNSIFRKEPSSNKVTTNNTVSPGNNNNTIHAVNPNEKIALGPVTDYNEFFNVNNIINKYYNYAVNNNYDAILEIFDEDYKIENKIVKSNISKFVNVTSDEVTYFAKKMYRKGQKGVRYYFVNGEMQKYDFANEILNEIDDILFMVTIDYNMNTYSIRPLASSEEPLKVAQEYHMTNNKKIKKINMNAYEEQSYNDEIIGTYYISYFKNMLYLNSQKAYEMLSSSSKSRFPELKNFSDGLSDIYESITPNIFSYGSSGQDGKRRYSIIMNNQKEIIFQENSIMNFTVTIP